MTDLDSSRLTPPLRRHLERLGAVVHNVEPPPEPTLGGQPVPAWAFELAQVEWPGHRVSRHGANDPRWRRVRLQCDGVIGPPNIAEAIGPALVIGETDGGERLACPLTNRSLFDAQVFIVPSGAVSHVFCDDLRDFFRLLAIDLASGSPWSGVTLAADRTAPATLAGEDLSGLVVQGGAIEAFSFDGAILEDGDLHDVRFVDVSFANARLAGTSFAGCDLSHVDLSRAMLTGAQLTQATLWQTRLTGAHLAEVNLREARLREVDLNSADLTSADLTEAHLAASTIEGAAFGAATFTGARLTDVTFVDCVFDYAVFDAAELDGVVFDRCSLIGARLDGATATNGVFRECELQDTTAADTRLEACQFIRCTPPGLDTDAQARPEPMTVPLQAVVANPTTPAPPAPTAPAPPTPTAPPPSATPPTAPSPPSPEGAGEGGQATAPDTDLAVAAKAASPDRKRAPWVYALASLLVPGVGQFMLGQKGPGTIFLVAAVLTLCAGGLVNVAAAVHAWVVASKG